MSHVFKDERIISKTLIIFELSRRSEILEIIDTQQAVNAIEMNSMLVAPNVKLTQFVHIALTGL